MVGQDRDEWIEGVDEDDGWVSKTKQKRAVEDLQDLGLRLAELSPKHLDGLGLPESLAGAVDLYKRIKSRPALKRQAQYIGRLMREQDEKTIGRMRYLFASIDGGNAAENARVARCERWRAEMIASDVAVAGFFDARPEAARRAKELRDLVRAARKEEAMAAPAAEKGAPAPRRAYRALFRLIRQIEGGEGSGDEPEAQD